MRNRTVLTGAIMVAAIGTGSAAALAVGGAHVFAGLSSSAPAKRAAVRPPAAPSAATAQYGTEPSTTQLTCVRITVSNSFNCTAQVNGAVGTPTGTVSFSNTGAGFFSPASCTLTEYVPGIARCSTTFTATASGPQSLFANYSGDPTYMPSSSGALLVTGH